MISNGKSYVLGSGNTNLPNVSSTLEAWFQTLVVGIVTKTQANFRTAETVVEVSTRGVLQPLSAQQLEIKPEGQRGWPWFMLHCQPSLSLLLDDTVIIRTNRYRVMARTGYDQYGYIQYDLVRDYDTIMEATP
jgi:hypothetical protein